MAMLEFRHRKHCCTWAHVWNWYRDDHSGNMYRITWKTHVKMKMESVLHLLRLWLSLLPFMLKSCCYERSLLHGHCDLVTIDPWQGSTVICNVAAHLTHTLKTRKKIMLVVLKITAKSNSILDNLHRKYIKPESAFADTDRWTGGRTNRHKVFTSNFKKMKETFSVVHM